MGKNAPATAGRHAQFLRKGGPTARGGSPARTSGLGPGSPPHAGGKGQDWLGLRRFLLSPPTQIQPEAMSPMRLADQNKPVRPQALCPPQRQRSGANFSTGVPTAVRRKQTKRCRGARGCGCSPWLAVHAKTLPGILLARGPGMKQELIRDEAATHLDTFTSDGGDCRVIGAHQRLFSLVLAADLKPSCRGWRGGQPKSTRRAGIEASALLIVVRGVKLLLREINQQRPSPAPASIAPQLSVFLQKKATAAFEVVGENGRSPRRCGGEAKAGPGR